MSNVFLDMFLLYTSMNTWLVWRENFQCETVTVVGSNITECIDLNQFPISAAHHGHSFINPYPYY